MAYKSADEILPTNPADGRNIVDSEAETQHKKDRGEMKNTGFNNRRMTVIGWKFVTLQYVATILNIDTSTSVCSRCADYGWQCD